MKKLFFALALLCMMSCASNNSSNGNSGDADSTNVEISGDNLEFLKEIAKKVTPEIDYGYQTLALDYLEELGFAKLEEILGCKLYLKGPHTPEKGWESYADEQGYYNPEAVKKLSSLVDKILEDKDFVKATKPIVDKYMSNRLMILVGMYQAIQLGGGFDPYMLRLPINESKDVAYSGIDYVYGCAYSFWERRKTDGTDKLFYNIVLKIFKTYFGYETVIDEKNCDEYIQFYDDYVEYEGEEVYEGEGEGESQDAFEFAREVEGYYCEKFDCIPGIFTKTYPDDQPKGIINYYYVSQEGKVEGLVDYQEKNYKFEGISLKKSRVEIYLSQGEYEYTFGIYNDNEYIKKYMQIQDTKKDKSQYFIDQKEVKEKKYLEFTSQFDNLKEESEKMEWILGDNPANGYNP